LRSRAFIAAILCGFAAIPAIGDGEGLKISNWPNYSNIGGSVAVTNFPAVQSVSVQTSTGTNVLVQNYQITGSTTIGQTVASYTVPIGVTFYLEYAEAESYYLTFTTSVSNFGAAYFSINGIHGYTTQLAGAGISRSGIVSFNPPLMFPAGTTVAWLVTPASSTGTVWYGNFGGYYK
jgi:hypothetical protein